MRTRTGGFTLIEILIVVAIIGVIAAMVVQNVAGRPDEARVNAARADLASIAGALELYRLDNFSYPSTDQGLHALIEEPSGDPEPANWKGAYLKKGREVPKDPWGTDYQYISDGDDFDIYSLAADRKQGGDGAAADLYYSQL